MRSHGGRRRDAVIPPEVRQLFAELELLSHGTTQSWNSTGSHTTDRAIIPPGESKPPHVTFRLSYLAASSDSARSLVVKEAGEELERFRGHGIDRSHVVGESQEQQNARLLKEGAGEPPSRVALVFHCTPTRVRRLRLAAGFNTETGRPTTPVATDLAVEARRLRDAGMSVRAIALALGKPKSTVHDLLAA